MENNHDKMFQFVDENSELIFNHDSMEDIVSNSRYAKKGKRYAKKSRSKFALWWRRRRRWQKGLLIGACAFVLVFTLALGVLSVVFRYNYNKITTNPEDLGFSAIIDKNIVNVALFGVDTRNMGSLKGLSDSIMIISLNTQTKKVKLLSVMRDSLVPIQYDGKTRYRKINSAYSLGGPELAIKTLNQAFGLDISEYATVNFSGMSQIIDAVGGIDVTLADGELDTYIYEYGKRVNVGFNGLVAEQCKYMGIASDGYFIRKGGTYHLNGVQAVAYARIRHAANIDGTNDDYGRTDRQRYVMEQLFNRALTLSKTQYAGLAKALIPCTETSLSYSEIMSLAINILLSSPAFEQTRVPLPDYQMPSKSYVYYDLNYASKLIHAFLYDNISPEDYMETNGIEKNDWYAMNSKSGGSSGSRTSSHTRNTDSSNTSSSPSVLEDPQDSTVTEPQVPFNSDMPDQHDGPETSSQSDTDSSDSNSSSEPVADASSNNSESGGEVSEPGQTEE